MTVLFSSLYNARVSLLISCYSSHNFPFFWGSRLGPPDFYPQTPNCPEETLTREYVQYGYKETVEGIEVCFFIIFFCYPSRVNWFDYSFNGDCYSAFYKLVCLLFIFFKKWPRPTYYPTNLCIAWVRKGKVLL